MAGGDGFEPPNVGIKIRGLTTWRTPYDINIYMNYYYKTEYTKYANQSLDWLPMDTKDLYESNLKHRYQDLVKYEWINKKITYTFNSEGFRCDEFTNDPSFITLGCSNTVGIGLPIECTWPHIISEKIGLKCFNLGIGGSSSDTAFRLGYHYINKIKPKIVFFLRPYGPRLEIINKHANTPLISYGNWNINFHKLNTNDYLYHYIQDDNNFLLNREKNTLAIKLLCLELNIKFIAIDAEKTPKLDLARDLAHRGKVSHLELVDKFISKI